MTDLKDCFLLFFSKKKSESVMMMSTEEESARPRENNHCVIVQVRSIECIFRVASVCKP
jgi:hypothetical protein